MKLLAAFAIGAVLLSAGLLAAAGMDDEVQKEIKNLKSKNATVRRDAAEAIGKIGQIKASAAKPAIPALIEVLTDPDARVRAAAATALSRLDEPQAVVPALIRVVKDDSEVRVRIAAATGLGLIGEPAREAVPALRTIVKEARDSKNDQQKRLARAANEAIRQIAGVNRKKN